MRAWQLLIALSCVAFAALGAEPLTVRSPDGKLELAFTARPKGDSPIHSADGRSLINASPLGLQGLAPPQVRRHGTPLSRYGLETGLGQTGDRARRVP